VCLGQSGELAGKDQLAPEKSQSSCARPICCSAFADNEVVQPLDFEILSGKNGFCLSKSTYFISTLLNNNILSITGEKLYFGRTFAAVLSARLLFSSPSAAITLARASRVASASAAMALMSCSGSRMSFTSTRSTFTPQGLVPSSRTEMINLQFFTRYN